MPDEAEERSLDLVQRVVLSALVIVVTGSIAVGLSAYLVTRPVEQTPTEVIILWAMTGVIGLVTAAVVLVINRRHPASPWLLLGLIPMAASAYWAFT